MFTLYDCDCVGVVTHTSNLKEMVEWATAWCVFHSQIVTRPTVVFDIDQTLVTAYNKPIKEICDFYKWCRQNEIDCHIITARGESARNRAETMRALKTHGIVGFKSLFMMDSGDEAVTFESVARYKRKARATVSQRYAILANFGDQWSDMGSKTQLAALGGLQKDARATGIFFVSDYPCLKLTNE